jgi:hypothetical protein
VNESERRANLAKNLEYLCGTLGSVTQACRHFGINRQQFNKYLSGKHLPSSRVLLAVAAHFALEPEDLFRNPADFSAALQGTQFPLPRTLQALPQFQRFAPFVAASHERLSAYYGVYFRYHNSSIYQGRILRSLVYLYEREDIAQYLCIERFPRLDDSAKVAYLFKYHGFALMVEERIFLLDFEGVQRNELTFSILVPQHRNVLRFLYGLVMGVAATALREPFSTRLALDFQGPRPIRPSQVKRTTTLLPSDPSIPVEVRAYLTGKNSSVLWAKA